MKSVYSILGLCVAGALSAHVALANDKPVKIGMITTLSGGGAGLGIDIRDGFDLGVKLKGGKLGGVATEVITVDDARKVDTAKQIATRMIKQDKVDVVTGIVWSNLAMAVIPSVTKSDTVYISPNAGPSELAGKGCDKNYFNVAWQNDNLHEAMGKFASDKGVKKIYLIAANYPAGKDALVGFKRFYKETPVGEVYTKMGAVDYAAEIANLRAAKPDAVYFFLPGGMGINFVKQYNQAGLSQEIPLYGPAFSFDEGILKAVGKAAIGVYNSSQWSWDMQNPANEEFVAAFRAEYNRTPSLYASQGYDTAMLLDSAIKTVGGDVSNKEAFRAALKDAKFASVRGNFKFGVNQHPVQDIYVREVVADGEGATNKTIGKVFTDHQDVYAAECKM
jgi:branched-chain amino acid transport system substrate-binding protein